MGKEHNWLRKFGVSPDNLTLKQKVAIVSLGGEDGLLRKLNLKKGRTTYRFKPIGPSEQEDRRFQLARLMEEKNPDWDQHAPQPDIDTSRRIGDSPSDRFTDEENYLSDWSIGED